MVRRCDSAKLKGWRRTASTIEKIAVLPPIPRAIVATATAVNPGVLLRVREA
jgi:hypothetical protein